MPEKRRFIGASEIKVTLKISYKLKREEKDILSWRVSEEKNLNIYFEIYAEFTLKNEVMHISERMNFQ